LVSDAIERFPYTPLGEGFYARVIYHVEDRKQNSMSCGELLPTVISSTDRWMSARLCLLTPHRGLLDDPCTIVF
jgi:hypothetical protein